MIVLLKHEASYIKYFKYVVYRFNFTKKFCDRDKFNGV
jgi:hypothetical protein